jgi:phage-related protein
MRRKDERKHIIVSDLCGRCVLAVRSVSGEPILMHLEEIFGGLVAIHPLQQRGANPNELPGPTRRRGRGESNVPNLIHSGVRPVIFHPKARDEIRRFSREARLRLGRGLFRLQRGESLGMPNARPMPTVSLGVWELRVRGEDGIFRVFYYTASAAGVLVFHAFAKKTQRTPAAEIALARKRLKELLDA